MPAPVKIADLKTRPPLEIMAEVAMLSRMVEFAKAQGVSGGEEALRVAMGAHDALRWALGLAEESLSDCLMGPDESAADEPPALENHIGKEAGTRQAKGLL